MESFAEIFKPLPEAKRLQRLRPAPVMTPAGEKLLAAAIEIRSTSPDAIERAYMARQLVQCTLPHSDPGKVERWMRRSGGSTLVLQAGWNATGGTVSLGPWDVAIVEEGR